MVKCKRCQDLEDSIPNKGVLMCDNYTKDQLCGSCRNIKELEEMYYETM